MLPQVCETILLSVLFIL